MPLTEYEENPMLFRQEDNKIHAKNCPCCYICNHQGHNLYHGLTDRLFSAPGEWNLKKCSNPGCGLVWLDPKPLPEEVGKAYKNYYTHHDTGDHANTLPRRLYKAAKEGYLAQRYGYYGDSVDIYKRLLGLLLYFHPGRRESMDFSVMYLPSQPNGLMLDIGCGSGHKLRFLQDLGWNTEGLDFDPVAVDKAKAKGLKVRLGNLASQNYPENCFDVITMSHLIEHVYDPLELLRECRRILKPGGRLVMITPNSESWGHKILKNSWLALDPPRHLYIFSLASLQLLAGKAGFEKYKISTTIREANGLFAASKIIQRTGQYLWGSGIPFTLRLWSRCMQFVEWALLKLKPGCGEEIAMVVEK
mgnify:CR=1 FL=1